MTWPERGGSDNMSRVSCCAHVLDAFICGLGGAWRIWGPNVIEQPTELSWTTPGLPVCCSYASLPEGVDKVEPSITRASFLR